MTVLWASLGNIRDNSLFSGLFSGQSFTLATRVCQGRKMDMEEVEFTNEELCEILKDNDFSEVYCVCRMPADDDMIGGWTF